MDGQQITPKSLQKELTRLIFIATLAVSVLAGLISGISAFFEAREMQDEILEQIARKVADNTINQSSKWDDDHHDSDIVVQSLKSLNLKHLDIDPDQKDGFDTIEFDDDAWRIYLITKPSKQRFIIAQQTELRDEIALANASSAMIPILIMAAILLIAINWIIWSRLQPIKCTSSDLI